MRSTNLKENVELIGYKGVYPTLMKVYNQQYSEIQQIPLSVALYLIEYNESLEKYIAQKQEEEINKYK